MTTAENALDETSARPTLGSLLRSPISVVWGVLICATLLSWWLGSGHGISSHTGASIVILCVAMVKVRLVGLYFMELRDAPLPLRSVFEGYCLLVTGVTIGMLLFV
jgi:heme/copper-type cytochrome/quinol oxidase subunit 4